MFEYGLFKGLFKGVVEEIEVNGRRSGYNRGRVVELEDARFCLGAGCEGLSFFDLQVEHDVVAISATERWWNCDEGERPIHEPSA